MLHCHISIWNINPECQSGMSPDSHIKLGALEFYNIAIFVELMIGHNYSSLIKKMAENDFHTLNKTF